MAATSCQLIKSQATHFTPLNRVLTMKGYASLYATTLFSCFLKASGQDLRMAVGLETQSLLTGESPPAVLGPVNAKIVEDNLEIKLTIGADGCYITESHICNIPAEINKYEEKKSVQLYSIPVEKIFDFVCAFESDTFVVAGHATVECGEELVGLVGVGEGGSTRRLQSGPYSYQAYYEIPINCEEAFSTTPEPFREDTTSTTSTTSTPPAGQVNEITTGAPTTKPPTTSPTTPTTVTHRTTPPPPTTTPQPTTPPPPTTTPQPTTPLTTTLPPRITGARCRSRYHRSWAKSTSGNAICQSEANPRLENGWTNGPYNFRAPFKIEMESYASKTCATSGFGVIHTNKIVVEGDGKSIVVTAQTNQGFLMRSFTYYVGKEKVPHVPNGPYARPPRGVTSVGIEYHIAGTNYYSFSFPVNHKTPTSGYFSIQTTACEG